MLERTLFTQHSTFTQCSSLSLAALRVHMMKHFKFKLMDGSLKKALDTDLIVCPHPGLYWLFKASFITLPFECSFFLHFYIISRSLILLVLELEHCGGC